MRQELQVVFQQRPSVVVGVVVVARHVLVAADEVLIPVGYAVLVGVKAVGASLFRVSLVAAAVVLMMPDRDPV